MSGLHETKRRGRTLSIRPGSHRYPPEHNELRLPAISNQHIRLLSWAVKRFETDDSATELYEEKLVTHRALILLMN